MTIDLCSDDYLELILSDRQDHPDYDSTVDHLSHCAHCQQRLDDLSARPAWWNQARRRLQEPLPDSAELLPHVDTIVSAELETEPASFVIDIQSFLEPPHHPEMLGRIGRYEIEREIGRGGMGVVLKGFDSELNRPVAVKVLSPHMACSGTARQRFIREARAAAAVVHENVIAIHGIETEARLPSIVMPYIDGPSLQQYIDRHGALEPADVVRIGIQIAAALAAAHDQGLVHRDIKPGNVLLENGINRVQITDFGLARAAHETDITRTGIITGTPAFMSPEQALSESIDRRSDLFSLGSVLYYAATGCLPFHASTPIGVLQQVCNGTPSRPCAENPGIPQHLESVIEKLLAKAPDQRFQTADELRKHLTDYLAHLQQPAVTAAPRRLITPSARQRRRRLWQRMAVMAGVPALVVLLLVTLSRPNRPPTTPPPSAEHSATGASEPATRNDVPSDIVSLITLDEELQQLDHEVTHAEHMFVHDQWPFPTLDLLDHQLDELAMDVSELEAQFQAAAPRDAKPAPPVPGEFTSPVPNSAPTQP